VDISAPPGTPILAIARERIVGIIQNWYQGQPFVWGAILDKLGNPTGQYTYTAEQITPSARPGQVVQQGQPLGVVAGSGTGLELGWATASGQTLAKASPGGYTEGQVTPAGQSFRASVFGASASQGSRTTAASPSQSLSSLWIQAGGSPKLANLMAAIALAESSGNVGATNKNTNGTEDRGLWQINSSHSQFDPSRLLTDPLYNAQAAVAIEKSQGLTAWSTYNSGAYQQFLGQASTATSTGVGRTRPGGETAGSAPASASQFSDAYSQLSGIPRTAPPNAAQDVSLTSEDVSFWGSVSSPFKWFDQQLNNAWGSMGAAAGAPLSAVGSTVDFLDKMVKFIVNPLSWLRVVEFMTGIFAMGFGLSLLTKSTAGVSNADIRKVTSNVIAGSPIGRRNRMRQGAREGHREGQAEFARNNARRASKAREAAKVIK
jgi:hypothetical protein